MILHATEKGDIEGLGTHALRGQPELSAFTHFTEPPETLAMRRDLPFKTAATCLLVLLMPPSAAQGYWDDAPSPAEGYWDDAYLVTHWLWDPLWSGFGAGIRADWGGAIVYVNPPYDYFAWGSEGNLVDNGLPDPGRQIQTASWRPGEPYPPCWPCNAGCHWGWNPTQGGNCAGVGSGYLTVNASSSQIYTRTQSLNFDNGLGRSKLFVEQTLRFVRRGTLEITYSLTNNETFSVIDGGHELPSAYLRAGAFHQPVTYIGNQPFSGAPVTTPSIPSGSIITVNASERWVAWLNTTHGAGLGLYVPNQGFFSFFTLGFTTSPSGKAMQHFGTLTLQPGQKRTVRAYLIFGTLQEIRDTVYDLEGY